MSDPPRHLGERRLTDGTTRPTIELPNGHQNVGGDGERIYAPWLPLAEQLAIVDVLPGDY